MRERLTFTELLAFLCAAVLLTVGYMAVCTNDYLVETEIQEAAGK